LSATQAADSEVAWKAVEAMVKGYIPVLVGLTIIDSVDKLKQLAWVIVLTHGYVAYDLNMSYLNGFNRLQEIGFGYIDNNGMGIALVTCCGLGLFLVIGTRSVWGKVVGCLALACMIHAILISFSRGAMLGLVVVGFLSLLLLPKRAIYYFVFAILVLITLAFAGTQVVERFETVFAGDEKRDSSADGRLVMWGICLEQVQEHPVLGLGPDHFPVYAHTFGLTKGKSAHTTWLQTAAELGLPGIAFLLTFYLTCIFRLAPWLWSAKAFVDPWFHDVARMVVASLGGFFITAQFVSLPGLEVPYYIVLLGAGALKLNS
jgi:O-antigen ligase